MPPVLCAMWDSIDKGRVVEETGFNASRNKLQAVTCSMLLRNSNAMLPWVADVVMRKEQGPRSASSLTEMSLVNGTQRINVLNYGICLMAARILVSTSGSSQ